MDIQLNLDSLRKNFYQAARALEKDAPDIARVKDGLLSLERRNLPFRVYYPKRKTYSRLPALVYYHGGGFVYGDLESHDMICRRLCAQAECVVFSVQYRKAPIHTFPAAHNDATDSWLSIVKNASLYGVNPEAMAIGGDSAGGNLAVHVSRQMALKLGPAPRFMLLYYPLLQFADVRSAPLDIKQSGMSLSPRIFEYFRDAYLPNKQDWTNPMVSPLFLEVDDLKNLPPSHFITSEWDPLTVEIGVFEANLRRFGIQTSIEHYENTVHGFLNLTSLVSKARIAIQDSAFILAEGLKTGVKLA